MSFALARRLDLRDRNGSEVVLAIARAMEPVATDALVEVLASDPRAAGMVMTWARRIGYQLLESSRFDTTLRFVLRKGLGGHGTGAETGDAPVAAGTSAIR